MSISYERIGDYLLPNLILEKNKHIYKSYWLLIHL